MIELTDKDISSMTMMLSLEKNFEGAGMYGHYAHMRKLERYGLIAFSHRTDGWSDIDGNEISDRPVYKLTALGKNVADCINDLDAKGALKLGFDCDGNL